MRSLPLATLLLCFDVLGSVLDLEAARDQL